MRYVFILLFGVLIGAGIFWLYQDNQHRKQSENIAEKIKTSAQSAGTAIANQFHKLRTEEITNELAKTGRVIREKAQVAGQAIADATADARITAAIKAKLAEDSGLASFKISVNTTDGVVTLSGAVSSADKVASAISTAMEVDGVRKVISTLQVKPN